MQDRISEVKDSGKTVANYEYGEDSTIKTFTLGNGVKTNYQYSANKNITKISMFLKDGSVLTENDYVYDNNNVQVAKSENGIKTKYFYDNIYQIKDVIYNEGKEIQEREEFKYDNAGNRIERIFCGEKEEYFYNAKNQLTSKVSQDSTVKYLYDKQGNTLEESSTKDGSTKYEYNSMNKPVKIQTNTGQVLENVYDAEGFRAEKSVDGDISKFVFSGWDIIAETDKDDNIKAREVRGYSLLAKENENGKYYYSHNDHGDVVYLTDGTSAVKNQYEYDVFGDIKTESESVINAFKYAGEQYDAQTSQYYLRARFYNPRTGRFTQEDVYRGSGLNLYVYVSNNPVLYVDPSGFALTIKQVTKALDEDDFGNKYVNNKKHYTAIKSKLNGGDKFKGELQSHHVLQGQWGDENLKKFGYSRDLAPTITLETSDGKGSKKLQLPHTMVSISQNARSTGRSSTSLMDELIFGGVDLVNANIEIGVIEEQLKRNFKMIDKLESNSLKLLESLEAWRNYEDNGGKISKSLKTRMEKMKDKSPEKYNLKRSDLKELELSNENRQQIIDEVTKEYHRKHPEENEKNAKKCK